MSAVQRINPQKAQPIGGRRRSRSTGTNTCSRTTSTPSHSLDYSMRKISHVYVRHYDEPAKWMFAAWLGLELKGWDRSMNTPVARRASRGACREATNDNSQPVLPRPCDRADAAYDC